MISPSQHEFEQLAARGFNLIPVAREIAADLETPVSAFLKSAQSDHCFLLESVIGGEKWARYSFLGSNPAAVIRSRAGHVELTRAGSTTERRASEDPFGELRRELQRFRAPEIPGLPRFYGGAVGFFSYDLARWFERLPDARPDDFGTPDFYLMCTGTVLIFDNVRQTLKIVANARLDESESARSAYSSACSEIDRVIAQLATPVRAPVLKRTPAQNGGGEMVVSSTHTRESFIAMVNRAKEYVESGEVIQVVPSQRFEAPLTVHPFNLYRSLRLINPSPYMFYFCLGDYILAGASPEVMVRVEGREATIRPIAGTRPRGASEAQDSNLERELRADPKERAEHLMLVDLARNDLSRVARLGSVEVSEMMTVERYSHVMHLVSNVRGLLRDECDAFDAFRATFPQGTVSGAPKIRAMQLIDELEPVRRGVYAGAVGYFSYNGNADTAITLRTMLVKGGRVYIQAGCGIVADSDPVLEYEESVNKAQAMLKALTAARDLEAAAQERSG